MLDNCFFISLLILLNTSLQGHWVKMESSRIGLLFWRHLDCLTWGVRAASALGLCFALSPVFMSTSPTWLSLQMGSLGLCSWLLPPVCCRDVLALPIFKQEEPQLSPENEARLPPLQYVLCAATSPAVKLHEETLTYLNQGSAGAAGQGWAWDCRHGPEGM